MTEARAAVPAAAVAAAVDEALRLGEEIEFVVVTVGLKGHAPTTVIHPGVSLAVLAATANVLGLVSKQAGCEVTVMPLPTTERGQG
jgi:hypothetical protein